MTWPGNLLACSSVLYCMSDESVNQSATSPDEAAARSDVQWQQILSPEEFHVLRQAGTERPFTGEYWDTTTEGVYSCRACGSELFASTTKFDAGCGWPSFFAPLAEDRVRYISDESLGMKRVEVRCANCDSHMGHVFEGEGFKTPTDLRYCMNSLSLTLRPAQG